MNISFEYLQRCSAMTGFATGPLEKVIRLGDIAADIFRHPLLGRVIIKCLSWESIIDDITKHNPIDENQIVSFYLKCTEYNRPNRPLCKKK